MSGNEFDHSQSLYRRALAEIEQTQASVKVLERELEFALRRLNDLYTLRDLAHDLLSRGGGSAEIAAPAPAASAAASPAPAEIDYAHLSPEKAAILAEIDELNTKSPAAQPAKPAEAPAKKGRRRIVGATPGTSEQADAYGSYNDQGIVEAAILLARKHGRKTFAVKDVAGWFEEVGYMSRRGNRDTPPAPNSIGVSLNRAKKNGTVKYNARLDGAGRGKYRLVDIKG